jgi:hypothetical protein
MFQGESKDLPGKPGRKISGGAVLIKKIKKFNM